MSVCRRISELTHRRYGLLDQETVVRRLNQVMTGWANYFQLGQVSPAYKAVDEHAIRRLRQWLCRKHKVRAGKYVRFPDKRLWNDMCLARLAQRTTRFPWVGERMISSESRVRENRTPGSMNGERKRGYGED